MLVLKWIFKNRGGKIKVCKYVYRYIWDVENLLFFVFVYNKCLVKLLGLIFIYGWGEFVVYICRFMVVFLLYINWSKILYVFVNC